MKTLLKSCRVPWAVSPTTSGLTLTHVEADVAPECTVVLGGGRLQDDGRTDDRRIEVVFDRCFFTRTGPHDDTEGIETLGYAVIDNDRGRMEDYWSWKTSQWRLTGHCPNSGFFVAVESAWLASLDKFFNRGYHHYVIDGRDGYIELIAKSFRWREWIWSRGARDDAPSLGEIVGEGEGVD